MLTLFHKDLITLSDHLILLPQSVSTLNQYKLKTAKRSSLRPILDAVLKQGVLRLF